MTDKEKLQAAIQALRDVMTLDGWGLDMSPPGPCYDVAKRALQKIADTGRKDVTREL